MNKVSRNTIIGILFLMVIGVFGCASFKKSLMQFVSILSDNQGKSISDKISEIEQNHKDNFYQKNELIDLYGLGQKALNKDMIGNFEYIKDNNNIIYRHMNWGHNVDKFNKDINKLKEIVDEKHIPLLYVQAPSRGIVDSNILIETEEAEDKDMDLVIQNITEYDINYLDIRDEINYSNIPAEDVFFKTDIHMKTKTEFWLAQTIAQYLEDNFSIILGDKDSKFEIENYESNKHDFLGNYAMSAGKYFAGLDTFEMLYPKFETNLEMVNKVTGETKVGDFKQVLTNNYKSSFNGSERTYWITNYLQYPNPYYEIKNNDVSDGNILLIMDSNGLRAASYLSLVCNQITVIDPRFYNGQDYLKQTLEMEQYDAVVILQGTALLDSGLFIDVLGEDDAQIMSQDAPTEIQRDETYTINITVKNTSDEIWNEDKMIRLCIWQDGVDWGYRINIPENVDIRPDEEYTFTLEGFGAPPSDSTFLEFQMVQEGIVYFGEKYRVDIKID